MALRHGPTLGECAEWPILVYRVLGPLQYYASTLHPTAQLPMDIHHQEVHIQLGLQTMISRYLGIWDTRPHGSQDHGMWGPKYHELLELLDSVLMYYSKHYTV